MKRKQSTQRHRPSRHRRRLFLMQASLLLALGCVAVRLQYVQSEFGPVLLKQAKQTQQVDGTLLAPRGALLDSTGQKLAWDLDAYTMDLHTSKIPDKQKLAELVSSALGVNQDEVFKLVDRPGWMQWPHSILEPAKEAIQIGVHHLYPKQDIGNLVTFTPTEQRFYPNGTFASNVIGYVSLQSVGPAGHQHDENVGQAGLEQKYDSMLRGVNGTYTYTRQADGFPVQTSIKVTQKPKPGYDVQLTIDPTIQGFVEQEMDSLVKSYRPEKAAIVVTNPNNGGILAMTSRPTFDPNHFASVKDPAVLSENFAVNAPFEPGSTFKVPVLAAALATHAVSLNDTFMSGHTYVSGHRISDWNWSGWGQITFQRALEESSNVGFATIAMKLGWPRLTEYMKKFGYLDTTGIDLPAEGSSLVFSRQYQSKLDLATSGFGQGIAVTPIQEIQAIGAIANGGKLIQPHLAQAILDPATHKVVKEIQPKVVNPQVVPPDVVKAVNNTMMLDVSEGIDKQGIVPGYDVGGKTGTAQVPDKKGGYFADRFIVSFVGYAPGWAPKVEVYVALYWPKTVAGNQWGSTVATPAAQHILSECMQYYHIAPRGAVQTVNAAPINQKTRYVETPDLIGKASGQAEAVVKQLGLKSTLVGGAGKVTSQWPQPGIEVTAGSSMYLSAADASHTKSVPMPDLTGVSMRSAGNILAAIGVNVVPHGSGYVVSQSIPPGRLVSRGASVDVTCSPLKQAVIAPPSNSTQTASSSSSTSTN